MQELLQSINHTIEVGDTIDIIIETGDMSLSLFDQEIMSFLRVNNVLNIELISGCIKIPVVSITKIKKGVYIIITELNFKIKINTTQ